MNLYSAFFVKYLKRAERASHPETQNPSAIHEIPELSVGDSSPLRRPTDTQVVARLICVMN